MEEHLEKLKNAENLLKSIVNKISRDIEDKKQDEEMEKYELETEDEFRKRFDNEYEWTEVDSDGQGEMEYSRLCTNTDCWYKGNSDRLGMCVVYRLIGYEDLMLCDMCMNTERIMEDYILRMKKTFKENKHIKKSTKKYMYLFDKESVDVISKDEDDYVTVNETKISDSNWFDIRRVLEHDNYDIDETTVWHVSKKKKVV